MTAYGPMTATHRADDIGNPRSSDPDPRSLARCVPSAVSGACPACNPSTYPKHARHRGFAVDGPITLEPSKPGPRRADGCLCGSGRLAGRGGCEVCR